jgi:hypothetical protein
MSVPIKPGPLANFSRTADVAGGAAVVEGGAATVAMNGSFGLETCEWYGCGKLYDDE